MKVNRWSLARRGVQLVVAGLLVSPLLGLGFFQGNLAAASLFGLELSDPLATLQVFLLTGTLAAPFLGGMALVVLLYFATGGRSFCGWVCPVHLLTDLSDKLPGNRRRPRWGLSWKWAALGVTAALSLLLAIPAFETVSPIGIATRALMFGPGPELALLALIVAAELLLVRRLWCRSLCPLGGLYAALGRVSPLKVGYCSDRCIHCDRCRQICFVPEVLDPPLSRGYRLVTSGECTRCGACVGACPTAALTFRFCNPLGKGA